MRAYIANRFLRPFVVLLVLAILSIAGLEVALPSSVSAQTSTYPAKLTVDGSLDVLVNGQQNDGDFVVNGDTVNVAFNNNTGSNVVICVKGSSPQSLADTASTTIPITVYGEDQVNITLSDGNSCMSGAGNPGFLWLEGAEGSLGCSIFNGKDWNLVGNYSYVTTTISMYRGSTYVASINADKGGGYYYNAANVNEEFSGQTSAATYYIYDGTSNSAELIGQATCAAVPAVSSSGTYPPTNTTPPSTSKPVTPPPSGSKLPDLRQLQLHLLSHYLGQLTVQ